MYMIRFHHENAGIYGKLRLLIFELAVYFPNALLSEGFLLGAGHGRGFCK